MSGRIRNNTAVAALTQVQRYMGEEAIENYQAGFISRRTMLRRLMLICGSATGAAALLAACGDSTATTTLPATATTIAPTTAAATSTPPIVATATSVPATATSLPATTAPANRNNASKSPLSVAANDPAIEAAEITYQSDTPILLIWRGPKRRVLILELW